jgi:hypothetical protein
MLPTQLLFFRTEAVPDALVVPALCKLGKGRSTLGPVSASNQKPWATRLNGLLAHPCGSEESLDARSTNAQASKTTKPGASDFGVAHEGASLGQPPSLQVLAQDHIVRASVGQQFSGRATLEEAAWGIR